MDRTLADIDEARLRAASRLPGWSVSHILTHFARHAESHTRMLRAAQAGRAGQQYPGETTPRAADIEVGAGGTAVVCADARDTAADLETTRSAMTPSGAQAGSTRVLLALTVTAPAGHGQRKEYSR